MEQKKNVVLIGMPGAGKSTVGVVVAKRLGFRFVDSDLVIQETYGRLLHELIEEHGIEGFWKLENEVNASLDMERAVIATGGSVCYEPEAMEHLGKIGMVVYLQLSCESLQERLGDLNARGVTMRKEQTLLDLYKERVPLYEKYAHIIVDCEGKQLREVAEEVCNKVKELQTDEAEKGAKQG